jgi:hypothetical protein
MSAVIDGVEITLLVDLADATMVLGRDVLGDVMHGYLEGAADITCETITAAWAWGAVDYRRGLTVPETGTLVATIKDPRRIYDPANEQGPHYEALRRDRPIRVLLGADYTAGGQTFRLEGSAWTGKVRSWSHDWISGRTTLTAYDTLEEAGRASLSTTVPAGTPVQQAVAAGTAAGIPVYVEDGNGLDGGRTRSTHRFDDNLLAALADCRFAAVGAYWCDRDGHLKIADRMFQGRVFKRGFTVGCDPNPVVTSLSSTLDRGELVNAVRVDRFDPQGNNLAPHVYRDGPSIAAHGLHALTTSEEELDLHADASYQDPYEGWAAEFLSPTAAMPMVNPEDEVIVGGVLAKGDKVVEIACSDWRTPFTLRLPGVFGRRLNLYGLRVAVTPAGWTLDLVSGWRPRTPSNTELPTCRARPLSMATAGWRPTPSSCWIRAT